jgi:hypothetical protein
VQEKKKKKKRKRRRERNWDGRESSSYLQSTARGSVKRKWGESGCTETAATHGCPHHRTKNQKKKEGLGVVSRVFGDRKDFEEEGVRQYL